MVLLFKDSELIFIFPQQVDLFFEMGDDDFFLVGLDFEGGVEVGGSGFGGAHVF